MNENIKKFLAKVEQDQELQRKFAQLRDPEEAYKLASSVQEGFTREEFITETTRLYEEATKDLSDEDLAKVAGGSGDGDAALIGGYVSGAISATAGAAGAAAT